jgi:hypothetical protein
MDRVYFHFYDDIHSKKNLEMLILKLLPHGGFFMHLDLTDQNQSA